MNIKQVPETAIDLLSLGECMIRLSPPGHGRIEFSNTLEVWVGGGEYNVPSERDVKIPPVCSQRTPLPNMPLKSIIPGCIFIAAEWPRSYIVTEARTLAPTSVKFRPMRSRRPTPSYSARSTLPISTPTARPWFTIRCPKGLSTSLLTKAVRRPSRAKP